MDITLLTITDHCPECGAEIHHKINSIQDAIDDYKDRGS